MPAKGKPHRVYLIQQFYNINLFASSLPDTAPSTILFQDLLKGPLSRYAARFCCSSSPHPWHPTRNNYIKGREIRKSQSKI